MVEVVLCEDCVHSHLGNKKRKPYRWLCTKFPRIENDNYVTRAEMINEPFMYCCNINGGACPLFEKDENNE